ncbi:dipeptidyl aminopeptidase/acylaminoacyl peptidase [Sphingopyxis panaciterrae]|uniref:S9 family peptidase n=1 Tax=Sphingopyxis panaciterrae TaxID=363841 RepID=UPI00142479BE|nr:S9 family peptidase [Sphingopyxis panaciterrae]NIJ35644.1 dipeptidyl aminopeptidase/acylaminoacyl peptidase [Sphingopyxis panaciterrae]
MQSDFRQHPLFTKAEDLTRAWLRPGTGEVAALGQLVASPDGRRAAAAALLCEALEGAPSTRLAIIDLTSGELETVTDGPRSDSAPAWSPDGRAIAFLSDREQAYANRLRILDVESGTDRATAAVNGFVEYLQWSADGTAILLGVAGFGSDLAGAQGAFSVDLEGEAGERPAWAPVVEGMPEAAPWRTVWLYDVAADTARQVTPAGVNVWQAVWCGADHIAAFCSDQPEETWWYSADVRLIEIGSGSVRTLFRPTDQLGALAATKGGATVAVVEAVCSDRNIVAGDVRLIDVASGAIARPAALGGDVVQLSWRNEDELLFVAAAGPETVIGLLDRAAETSRELWRGGERTPSGAMFPEAAPLGANPGDVLFLCESFFEAPALVALEAGTEREIRRFGTSEVAAAVAGLGSARDFSWTAPDGLEMHGWLLTPPGPGPHPLIMQVHGGPVWYTRPIYIGRSALPQMALAAGYALFQPNPRGSSGRGQSFARKVFGDMGGADTHDYLSGLDALEKAGIADPARLGVTGGSYGGFMTSWLITQDQRFAAAVPVAPVTNWVSEHLTCHVPTFCEIFLDDRLSNPTGKYFTRSPIHFADRAKTPTLNICGALDKITPAGQALEFHHALQIAGIESVLVTYPHEGHGVRTMPASFDYTARTMAWFERHMPANSGL